MGGVRFQGGSDPGFGLYSMGATEDRVPKKRQPPQPVYYPGRSLQRPPCQQKEISAGITAISSAGSGVGGMLSTRREAGSSAGARQAGALTWKVLDKGVVESVA